MKKLVVFCVLVSSIFANVIINNPHDLIKVKISKKTVNRIVLPEKILDIAYSKEKGLIIKTTNNQAFLKYEVVKKQKYQQLAGAANPNSIKPIGKAKLVYKSKPCEVYFITQNKTYSFVFYPTNSEKPQTIIVNDFAVKAKKVIKYETEDSYVKTLSKLSTTTLKGLVPYGYKELKKNKVVYRDKVFTTTLKKEYIGVIYKVKLFEVKNKGNKPVKLNTKVLYNLADKTPVSITVFYNNDVNYLLPYSSAKVLIIEKRN
jgi:conjugal transfer pilus assembly protein TraK